MVIRLICYFRLIKFPVIYLLLVSEPCFPISAKRSTVERLGKCNNAFGELHRFILEAESIFTSLAKIPGVLVDRIEL